MAILMPGGPVGKALSEKTAQNAARLRELAAGEPLNAKPLSHDGKRGAKLGGHESERTGKLVGEHRLDDGASRALLSAPNDLASLGDKRDKRAISGADLKQFFVGHRMTLLSH